MPQRKAVFAKFDRMPPAEVYRRLAPSLARFVSADTAVEMTRFYNTPYGKKLIHGRYNSAAHVAASKEFAAAEPARSLQAPAKDQQREDLTGAPRFLGIMRA